jgi:putative ABC transport system substrate-binding protein
MAIHIRRRDLIAALGGASAWPFAALAQQAGKLPTIGFLGSGTPASQGRLVATFAERMRELGWIDARSVAIDVRWAEGRTARLSEIAAEFVRLKVDVIVTIGTPATVAAKRTTAAIPIVCISVADPVATGLVASLRRPGGNVTGLSNQQADLAGKRLELLREVVPRLRRLGIVTNAANPAAAPDMREVQAAASMLGVEIATPEIRRAEDIAPAFETFKGWADALYVFVDLLVIANQIRINTLALGNRLPTMHAFREQVEAGGLMSYGANLPDLYRHAAQYVDAILRGARPADLPVEQPTKFDFVINLTTAKALGLKIPEAILLRADEVIE